MPLKILHVVMYIAPSIGHILLNINLHFKLINRVNHGLRLFSDVWSENASLFESLMEIYSNPPILYYGFNMKHVYNLLELKHHCAVF